MPSGRILIVEDEDKLRRVIQLHLGAADFEIDGAATAEQAMAMAPMADVILTDLRLPGMDGLQFVQQLQARGIQAGIIVMTAHGSVETAVEAMKLGAATSCRSPSRSNISRQWSIKSSRCRCCALKTFGCGKS